MEFIRKILNEVEDVTHTVEERNNAFDKFFERIRERYESLKDIEVGEADPCFVLIAYLMSLRDVDVNNRRIGGEPSIIDASVFKQCESCEDIEYIISKFAHITRKDRALKKKVRDRIRNMRSSKGKFDNYVNSLSNYFGRM